MSHINTFRDDGEESGILGDDNHREINKYTKAVLVISRLRV